MKVLAVCKRCPQQRDLMTRPYGRFHHLLAGLAELGHSVEVLLISHRGLADQERFLAGVNWIARDVRTSGAKQLLAELESTANRFSPDWVVSLSDTWCAWIAHRLARRNQASLLVDAYDNYEAYMPWNLPLHWLYRRAIQSAEITTAAGPQLAQLMDRHRRGHKPTAILPMAADPGFAPRSKSDCRKILNLPEDVPLIGYSGGWAAKRGTQILPEAFRLVRRKMPQARLILTGRPPDNVTRLPNVLPLGYLDDALLPAFLNAMDVSAVITTASRFGLYSYPAKLCEAIACGTPVVATATPPVQWMLEDQPQSLVPIDDPEALAEGLLNAIALRGRVEYSTRPDWADVARSLDELLRSKP